MSEEAHTGERAGASVRREYPRVILGSAYGDGPRLGRETLIIEPGAAIDWLANGTFVASRVRDPRMIWLYHDEEAQTQEAYAEGAKKELAEEILVEAIMSGRVQCVYVENGANGPTLTATDPNIFKDGEVDREWDEGLELHISYEDGGYSTIKHYFLLWAEVLSLRPSRDPDRELLMQEPALPQTSSVPVHVSRSTTRGRPSGRHGAPFASFCVEVLLIGASKLAAEKEMVLGAMLRAHFERMGITPPNERNSEMQAKAAVEELTRARIKCAKTD